MRFLMDAFLRSQKGSEPNSAFDAPSRNCKLAATVLDWCIGTIPYSGGSIFRITQSTAVGLVAFEYRWSVECLQVAEVFHTTDLYDVRR